MGLVQRFCCVRVALRCLLQRALFLGWLLPAVGVLNVRIAFNQLWPEAISGELQRELTIRTAKFKREAAKGRAAVGAGGVAEIATELRPCSTGTSIR